MRNKHIRLIASDLDGTLLNDDKVFTERTKQAISKAMDQGVIFVPATGRPLFGIPKDVLEFPGVRYVITANGARIIDAKENKCLQENLLSYEKGLAVFDAVKDFDCYMEAYFDGKGYGTKRYLPNLEKYVELPAMREYILNSRERVDDVVEFFREKKSATDKVQAFFRTLEERQEAVDKITATVEGVYVTGALESNIEVGAEGVDKEKGLICLSEITGIPLEEMMVFGDGRNDTTMIRDAGVGVAMENACEEAKAVADIIAGNNNEDGVARIIETYILNE